MDNNGFLRQINSQEGSWRFRELQVTVVGTVFQSLIIVAALHFSIGYFYVFLLLIFLHAFLLKHYIDVARGRKKVWISLMMDYPVLIFFQYSIPLFVATIALNLLPPSPETQSFYERNVSFVNALEHSSALNVPPDLQVDTSRNIILVYTYVLTVFSSTFCALLSSLLWWPMSNRWVYRIQALSIGPTTFHFLILVGGALLTVYAPYQMNSDYGYSWKKSLSASSKGYDYSFTDYELVKQTWNWVMNGFVIAIIVSGIVGCLRHYSSLFGIWEKK